jgi:hypothetical protein
MMSFSQVVLGTLVSVLLCYAIEFMQRRRWASRHAAAAAGGAGAEAPSRPAPKPGALTTLAGVAGSVSISALCIVAGLCLLWNLMNMGARGTIAAL